jgi:formylglycine-generating enzyme required for sulfatase activity
MEGSEHNFELVRVPGTSGEPFLFGRGSNRKPIEVSEFYIATTPVTQALWLHVMGSNPAVHKNLSCPVENVSWKDVAGAGGFLDRINTSEILKTINKDNRQMRFRLPSETEWEYVARGGSSWQDGLTYSGSNDPDEVAWYGPRWRRWHDMVVRVFGWRLGWRIACRVRFRGRLTHTHDVALKAPNQIGIYDMSGNVWEWCQDVSTDNLEAVPADGRPYVGPGEERRLRGGCHHNWNLHCTVSWRYGIVPNAADGCIGFRVLLGT